MEIYNNITVITGAMFAEKSGELIKRLTISEKYEGKKVIAFKPTKDTRTKGVIKSRIGLEREAIYLPNYISKSLIISILHDYQDYDVIGFDEAQFFSGYIVGLIHSLAIAGKRVIVSGLNKDSEGQPFGHMGEIMAIADEILIQYPVCTKCHKRLAVYSQCLVEKEGQTLVGSNEYEPRCRECMEF